MTEEQLFEHWLLHIDELSLVVDGGVNHQANANMTVFRVAALQESVVRPEALSAFLTRA